MNKILKKFLEKKKFKSNSYSQCGEDLIVKFIFNTIGINKPTYLDIGAHHPYFINNTAIFYLEGSTGINIEPDPVLFKKFNLYRKKDINLNIGLSNNNSILDFYIMSPPTLNTFSKIEAESYTKQGEYKIKEIKKISTNTINWVLNNYNNGKFPDFLTLDAEGLDELILNQVDFEKNYPIVICVETISFSNLGRGEKNEKLIKFILEKGYILFGDTNINSIFVKSEYWKK